MLRVRAALVASFAAAVILGTSGAAGAVPRSGTAGGVAPAQVTAAAETYGPYRIEFVHSGKCLNNPGGSAANNWLIQWTCTTEPNARWYLDYIFSSSPGVDWYEIRNAGSGKCLNVAGASLASGAHVVQYSCAGDYPNNQWTIDRGGSGITQLLTARHSMMCLNVSGASKENGAKIVQYECGRGYDNELVMIG
jgi:hypothetical protein